MSLTLTVRKVHSTNTDKNLYFCLEKKAHSNQWISLFHIVLQDQSYTPIFKHIGGHKWRHVTHLEGRRDLHLPKDDVIPYYSLFSKKGDKGETGVKNLRKWVMLFIDGPLFEIPYNRDNKPSLY